MTIPDCELEFISVDAQAGPLLPGEVERILRHERVFASCPLVREPDAVSVAIAITADDRVLTVNQQGRAGGTAESYRPRGWAWLVGDTLLAGTAGALRPRQRDGRYGRVVRYLHGRPGLRAAISCIELLAGGALIGGRSPASRALGVAVVVDALVDLVILGARQLQDAAEPPPSATSSLGSTAIGSVSTRR